MTGDLLGELRSGRRESLDAILPVVYAELRAIAHRQLGARGHGGSLATTALVHEAYFKLVDQSRAGWRDRAHFLALAAVAMRHVLIDRARARVALKRGGGERQVTLEAVAAAAADDPEALLEMDDALRQLAAVAPRLARVVECRYFGGLSVEETAESLGLSTATVKREWRSARAWLYAALHDEGYAPADGLAPDP